MSSKERPGWCDNLVRAGGLRRGERVLVVVDEPLLEEGAELAAATRQAGASSRVELWSGERPLEQPPPQVIARAAEADLVLFMLKAPHSGEAAARFALAETALGHNGRMIFMGFVDGDLLRGELSKPAPELGEKAQRLIARVRGAKTIRLRGRAGTDLTFRVAGRPWLTDTDELGPGGLANYPGGEIFVAPHRDGADGVLVADLTVPYTLDGLVDEPVIVRFERGRAISIEGGRAAAMLRELVASAGEGADVIAELGIGLNPAVTPRGHVMLDEKAGGTAHVALGRNTGPFGGDNDATIHIDCILSAPRLEADGRPLEIII
jgi:leucyl aminopeptidase (aminopeptidase T)